ncbi:MAG TPA: hypothetical protein VGL57_06315 [Solirubrobacteraceae bacterium]|jgi:uncharacterized membrane protein SpoIIM required for sporulation
MSILYTIWFGLLNRTERAMHDERGEVIPWVVLTIGLVLIAAAIIAVLRPAVQNAAQQIVSSL